MKFAIEKYKFFEHIFSMKQEDLKTYITNRLYNFYPVDKVVVDEDYVYAIGDIPIALVAHLDTVWENAPPKFIFFDPFKSVMWALKGLGADDRAGCLAILDILQSGLRPHVIFTVDEEIGGLGATTLASIPCPFDDCRYIIELDRRGSNDCVFYECESKDFQKYVETFGFKTAVGTFSDISMICSSWQICGVNLSIGYYNEHTEKEMLFLSAMYNTISRVIKMLSVPEIPTYEWEGTVYIPTPVSDYFGWIDDDWGCGMMHCKRCRKLLTYHTAVGANDNKGGISYYCFDCMQKCMSYCPGCGEPFDNPAGIMSDELCPTCKDKREEHLDENYQF